MAATLATKFSDLHVPGNMQCKRIIFYFASNEQIMNIISISTWTLEFIDPIKTLYKIPSVRNGIFILLLLLMLLLLLLPIQHTYTYLYIYNILILLPDKVLPCSFSLSILY